MDLNINNFTPLELCKLLSRVGPLEIYCMDVELKDSLKAHEKVQIVCIFIPNFHFLIPYLLLAL